jgi:ribosomal protein L34
MAEIFKMVDSDGFSGSQTYQPKLLNRYKKIGFLAILQRNPQGRSYVDGAQVFFLFFGYKSGLSLGKVF